MSTQSKRALVALAALVVTGSGAGAQGRLVDIRTLASGAVFESWTFRNPVPGAGSAMVSSASEFTVPMTTVVPITENWAVDSYVAYAAGNVTVDRGGPAGRQTLSVAGLNDVKLRVVGRIHGDHVLLTLGGSIPNGASGLNPNQLDALGVLAAPALRFRTPNLGNGPTGTTGLVVAGQVGSWSLALAGAYEVRGDYAPAEALTAGLARPTLRAGNAIRFSLGADRALGSTHETFSLIADLYGDGRLTDPDAALRQDFRLGPSITGSYQVEETKGNTVTTIYMVERARMDYSVAGQAVADSWRNETETGVLNTVHVNPATALRFGIDGRFHTTASRAAATDNTLASFAAGGILAGGATFGVQMTPGGGAFSLEPFLRGQIAKLDLGGPVRRATGASAGVTLTTRF